MGSGFIDKEKLLGLLYLTEEMLREKGACTEGLIWFKRNFPHGSNLSHALAKCENAGWISWTLNIFGKPVD